VWAVSTSLTHPSTSSVHELSEYTMYIHKKLKRMKKCKYTYHHSIINTAVWARGGRKIMCFFFWTRPKFTTHLSSSRIVQSMPTIRSFLTDYAWIKALPSLWVAQSEGKWLNRVDLSSCTDAYCGPVVATVQMWVQM
jgi:hypothetical protein